MKATKLPSGNYRVQLVVGHENGKRIVKSFTAETKKEAELKALLYKPSKNPTFEVAMGVYINQRENVLSPASIKKYRSLERSKYLEPIKPIQIDRIEASDIQAIINTMGVNHAPKTVRSMHGFIAGILNANGITSPKVTLPQKQRPKNYLPTDDDIKKLYEAVKGTNYELPVYLATIGCMRRAEICAIEASDLNENMLHVNKEMVLNDKGEWIIKHPKSFKGDRYIPLPDYVCDLIRTRKIELTPNTITNQFPKILKRNNIPHFKFHDLRRYGASVLSKLGINTFTIMSICGWDSEKMLNDIYRYQFNDELKNVYDKSSEFYNKITR